MKYRTERKADFNLGFGGGIVLALVLAAIAGLQYPWLPVVLIGLAVTALVAWAGLNGWRLRNPFHLLPLPKTRTQAEEARRESTRKVRDAFTLLLHAKARPAATTLSELVTEMMVELKGMDEPYFSCGVLVDVFAFPQFQKAEEGLRKELEGRFWGDFEEGKGQDLQPIMAELLLDKQTADELGLNFFIYYGTYRLLYQTGQRLTAMLPSNADREHRFNEWRKLNDELTTRLREVLAMPELAHLRKDFEEHIAQIGSHR